MLRRYTRSNQNSLTITASVAALVLMIVGLTVVSGRSGAWVTTAGLVLLAASSCYSWWLGQTQRRVSVHRRSTGQPERK